VTGSHNKFQPPLPQPAGGRTPCHRFLPGGGVPPGSFMDRPSVLLAARHSFLPSPNRNPNQP